MNKAFLLFSHHEFEIEESQTAVSRLLDLVYVQGCNMDTVLMPPDGNCFSLPLLFISPRY